MKGFLPGTLLDDLRTQKLRLALTLFGIFWGTLSLGRSQEAARSRSEASQSVQTRRS